MKALSIIGIVLSIAGILTCLYIMSEAHCDCSYNYVDTVASPEAITGSMVAMMLFIFFLVFSIVAALSGFSKRDMSGFPSPAQQVAFNPQNYPQYPSYPNQFPNYNPQQPGFTNPYTNPPVTKNNPPNGPHNPWEKKE